MFSWTRSFLRHILGSNSRPNIFIILSPFLSLFMSFFLDNLLLPLFKSQSFCSLRCFFLLLIWSFNQLFIFKFCQIFFFFHLPTLLSSYFLNNLRSICTIFDQLFHNLTTNTGETILIHFPINQCLLLLFCLILLLLQYLCLLMIIHSHPPIFLFPFTSFI